MSTNFDTFELPVDVDPATLSYPYGYFVLRAQSYRFSKLGAQGEIQTHGFTDLQSVALGHSATCAYWRSGMEFNHPIPSLQSGA